ncbi:MAG: helix-turn-helix domain-containing protein [Planctomycetota bacterium]
MADRSEEHGEGPTGERGHAPESPAAPGASARDALPSVTLDAEPGAASAQAWRASASPLFETEPVGHQPGYHAGFTGFMVDGLLFSRNRFSPSIYRRTGQHLRGSDQDYITLHLPLKGAERGHLGDQDHVMDPGRITLADWAHPFSTVSEAVDKIGVVIPRSRVPKAALLYKRRPAIHWALDEPAGRLFGNTLASIWRQLPRVGAAEGQQLTHAMLGLLDGMIGSAFGDDTPADSGDASDQLLAAMKTYLIRHHDDPGLGPDQLAVAFGCSRATVYRLFNEENGVKSYLRRQRLQRCFETLKLGRSDPNELAAMWSRYGFNSPGHFRRAFQQAFGLSPRELAEAVQRSAGPPGPPAETSASNEGAIDRVHRWLAD